jgi:hypothetical protein
MIDFLISFLKKKCMYDRFNIYVSRPSPTSYQSIVWKDMEMARSQVCNWSKSMVKWSSGTSFLAKPKRHIAVTLSRRNTLEPRTG